mgnify:CR=1 FL=1|tara:strand:+ start:141 stop:719 length:579 start_codon:yes stop_codon:yes gene_type:complete
MGLNDYIVVHDNFLDEKPLGKLTKWVDQKVDFEQGKILGSEQQDNVLAKDVRNTLIRPLYNYDKSMTHVHWHNYLTLKFKDAISIYSKTLNILDLPINRVNEICLLKYPVNGKYEYHVDHAFRVPRSISMVFLLNEEYEGGQLCFRKPNGEEEHCVPVGKNRLIMWPSTFLYPHTVKPVTKGVKYSIVCWAL